MGSDRIAVSADDIARCLESFHAQFLPPDSNKPCPGVVAEPGEFAVALHAALDRMRADRGEPYAAPAPARPPAAGETLP